MNASLKTLAAMAVDLPPVAGFDAGGRSAAGARTRPPRTSPH